MDIRFWSFKSNRNSNENKNKNATGEDTYTGALRAPRAGSPAVVFVFVLTYVQFENRKILERRDLAENLTKNLDANLAEILAKKFAEKLAKNIRRPELR